MTKFDIYQEVTDRIIQQLQQGIIPWRKPWKMSGLSIKGATDLRKLAFNRITKTAYSALNQMLLSRAGEYASYKQWQDLGGKVKKGAKTEIVVFWKWIETTTKDPKTVKPGGSFPRQPSALFPTTTKQKDNSPIRSCLLI